MVQIKRDRQLLQDRDAEELEAEVYYLRTLVKTQAELIAELQSRVDPYSQDGKAICNSLF